MGRRRMMRGLVFFFHAGAVCAAGAGGVLSLPGLSAAGAAAALVFLPLSVRAGGRGRESEGESSEERAEVGRDEDSAASAEEARRRAEAEERLGRVEAELETLRRERKLILHSFQLVDTFLPYAGRMADIIFDKGEKASTETSDHFYQIGEASRKVGTAIQTTLGQMLEGEDNLHGYVDDLTAQTGRLAETDEAFKGMRDSFTADLEKSRSAVGEIGEFSQMISDLAERTNILAINASIEAARVGSAGKGFGVIAGEVQKLSRNSFEIAAKIQGMSKDITGLLEGAFENQASNIQEAAEALAQVRTNLEDLSGRLHDRVHDVGESISQSRELSETVLDQIGRITVSMQSQDLTRQVLEHIMTLFKESLDRGRRGIEQTEKLSSGDKEALTRELQSMARKVLTVEEEYRALEMEQQRAAVGRREEGMKGEVELF